MSPEHEKALLKDLLELREGARPLRSPTGRLSRLLIVGLGVIAVGAGLHIYRDLPVSQMVAVLIGAVIGAALAAGACAEAFAARLQALLSAVDPQALRDRLHELGA